MKKYLALSLFCIFGLAGVGYLYTHSRSQLQQHHQKIINLLNDAQQSEVEVEKDVLRLRDFLAADYDALTVAREKLELFCSLDNDHKIDKISFDVFTVFSEYCYALEAKLAAVEDFKSINSAYKNSLLFLHDHSVGSFSRGRVEPEAEKTLVYAIMTYALLSDATSKTNAEQSIRLLKRHKSADRIVIDHATKLLSLQEAKREAVELIVNSTSSQLLVKLRNIYLQEYQKEFQRAEFYQNILFGLCVTLIFIFVFNVLNIWKGARELQKANLTLEQRVDSRTKELVLSQKIITGQQQSLALSSKMSALGEMAGGVAHEINTPLAVIQMRTDLMLENLTDQELDKETFKLSLMAIDITVKRIGQIVKALRSFARDGSKDELSLYPVQRIIEDTFGLCRERFANHGIHLECSTVDESLQLNCRPGEISQVLLNLLNNAYDAVQELNAKWVKVEAYKNQDGIFLCVSDSGSGIPLEIQTKMMQPFFTTKEIGKGTGLGLSISRGFVENHGGKLTIDNAASHTKFVLSFPIP
ncbi:DAHL domain-containing protein [Pseudobdellovibrio sp. HCB154]|uniref:DAHL domain-containing protein n=1 Tax=Pseudobdellovibrio sp. HCB154 TaxID=3386277 RepID=UPI003916E283